MLVGCFLIFSNCSVACCLFVLRAIILADKLCEIKANFMCGCTIKDSTSSTELPTIHYNIIIAKTRLARLAIVTPTNRCVIELRSNSSCSLFMLGSSKQVVFRDHESTFYVPSLIIVTINNSIGYFEARNKSSKRDRSIYCTVFITVFFLPSLYVR